MKRQTKLTSEEQTEQQAAQQLQQPAVTGFKTPEEMLRHDAMHTPVPPSIAHRLAESLGTTTPPAQPWWRRLFGTK